jgi:hypothetical protein
MILPFQPSGVNRHSLLRPELFGSAGPPPGPPTTPARVLPHHRQRVPPPRALAHHKHPPAAHLLGALHGGPVADTPRHQGLTGHSECGARGGGRGYDPSGVTIVPAGLAPACVRGPRPDRSRAALGPHPPTCRACRSHRSVTSNVSFSVMSERGGPSRVRVPWSTRVTTSSWRRSQRPAEGTTRVSSTRLQRAHV